LSFAVCFFLAGTLFLRFFALPAAQGSKVKFYFNILLK